MKALISIKFIATYLFLIKVNTPLVLAETNRSQPIQFSPKEPIISEILSNFLNKPLNRSEFKAHDNVTKLSQSSTQPQNDKIFDYVLEDNSTKLNNYLNSGGNPDKYFHSAVAVGAIKCVKTMIKHGANVNSVDVNNDKLTPLMVAATHTYRVGYSMNELLVKSGANVNDRASRGSTPIMFASWGTAQHYENEYVKVVKLFIRNSANVNAKNDNGKSALSIAQSGKWVKITTVLKKAGAKI
jgi:uncharacterized protein